MIRIQVVMTPGIGLMKRRLQSEKDAIPLATFLAYSAMSLIAYSTPATLFETFNI